MKRNDYRSRLKVFLSVLCKRPVKLLIGAVAYIRLMSRDKNTHYIVLPYALGDSIYALAYLKEYKKQQGYEHVTIVCTKSVKRVSDFWKDTFEALICVDRKTIKGLLEIPHTIWGPRPFL